MTIVLTYTTKDGTQEHFKFESDITKIDLSNREITNIDLSSLSECTSLREIDLHDNQLQSIDLNPLSACKELSGLNLGNNQLLSINLTPLRSCPNLEKLFLYWNYLKKETVIPIFTEIRKEETEQSAQVESTYVVPVDSTTLEMTVSTTSRNIDFSGLADCKHLEEIIIRQCENVESIDLSPLNNSSTLLVIRIDRNGPFKQLIMPSGCENLEGIVMTSNGARPPKREDEEITVIVGKPTKNLKIDGFEILPTGPHQVTAGWPIVTIDGAPSIQKPQPISFSEIKARRVVSKPTIVDLSGLDGSPNLRVITMKNNNLSVILPSKCSHLEAVVLENTMIEEWRLEECPAVRFVRLNHRGADFDFGSFLEQFESSRRRPIIFIKYDFDEAGTGYGVVGFNEFPQKIKECFVSGHRDKRWGEYIYLNNDYQTDISVRIKQRRDLEIAQKERKLEREANTLEQISKCSNSSDLRKLLREAKYSVRNADEVVNILEDLLSDTPQPLNRELAYVALNYPPFDEQLRKRISCSILGILEPRKPESVDYIKLLRETVILPAEAAESKTKRSIHLSRINHSSFLILNCLFESYNRSVGESLFTEFTELFRNLEDVNLQTILLVSLISQHVAHSEIVTEWFLHDRLIDSFSSFISENLMDLYYSAIDSSQRESLLTFFNKMKMDSRIIKGITSYITNRELNVYEIYDMLAIVTSTNSLIGEEDIVNALLGHSSVLVDMIKSKEELFGRGSELWCWHLIRLINMIPSLMESAVISDAISSQIEFIAGCMIFRPPEDYPIYLLINQIVDVQSLLKTPDIMTALCFCFRFNDHDAIDSNTISKLLADDDILKHPLLREALQGSPNIDIRLPIKFEREFTSYEIKKSVKTIKDTRYPMAAVMNTYFDKKAWKHKAVRECALARLDDIAEELESGHNQKYAWWNYYAYSWYLCQVDILFEHEEIVSTLRLEKSEILNNLRGFSEDPPNEILENALSALRVFWSEYEGTFREMTPEEAEIEKRRLQRKTQLKERTELAAKRAESAAKKLQSGERLSNEEFVAFGYEPGSDEKESDLRNVTLYDLVKLWTHPRHPWTPRLFLEILEEFKGPYNEMDELWDFIREFPTDNQYNWRTYPQEEQRKSLIRLLSEWKDYLDDMPLTNVAEKYYIQSRKLVGSDIDDDF